MKPTCKNITEYVNKNMDRTGINNIRISLPRLNRNTLSALRHNFKVVKEEHILGYVYFER